MNHLKVEILYRNNLNRVKIGDIDYVYEEDTSLQMLFENIYRILEEKKCLVFSKDAARFKVNLFENIEPSTKICDLSVSELTVIYSEVVPANCARKIINFDEAYKETGFRFEMCTSEKCHPFLPHVNVTYGLNRNPEKMIRIAIETCEPLDPLPAGLNRGKLKPALVYISNNKEELLDEWDRLVNKS